MRLYLDVCCLNRPFDDQEIDRNRLEAEAVIAVVSRIRKGAHELVISDAVAREVDACPDVEKSDFVRQIMDIASSSVQIGPDEIERWEQLVALGFRELDALHIACAESGGCDFFLTTDDKLAKRSKALKDRLQIRVLNPLLFVTEVEP